MFLLKILILNYLKFFKMSDHKHPRSVHKNTCAHIIFSADSTGAVLAVLRTQSSVDHAHALAPSVDYALKLCVFYYAFFFRCGK